MRLVQLRHEAGGCQAAMVEGDCLVLCQGDSTVAELALEARRTGVDLSSLVANRLSDRRVDYDEALAERRLLPPVTHRDPAHFFVTGTGLTHLGSAAARDKMHAKTDDEAAKETDSMKLFRWGLERGKPSDGSVSVQPEWFYKGNGLVVAPPGGQIASPAFALDGGEEAELVGLYVVADDGAVLRIGHAIGNEFSDHVMERQNYLYLAHSKLRPCSFGPEVRLGPAPDSVNGTVSIERAGQRLWSAPFATGPANMAYEIASLEHHHFKYAAFRQPGDVHCHFFGTATLSFANGVKIEPGDEIVIAAKEFGRPLRNTLAQAPDQTGPYRVESCS